MSIDDKLFKLMFDDNFHICMIYGIEIKSNQINQSRTMQYVLDIRKTETPLLISKRWVVRILDEIEENTLLHWNVQ
jgi:hypothetical protein